jgi:hypothetical protein
MGRTRDENPNVVGGHRVPIPLRTFLELYDDGRYWDSHEALEDLWRETGSAFYQALILYASAWVHWERHNAHGVNAQLRKTLERLHGYPEAYLGFDVAALRRHCETVRSALSRDLVTWHEHVAPMPLALTAARCRGDEEELTG